MLACGTVLANQDELVTLLKSPPLALLPLGQTMASLFPHWEADI